MAESAPEESAQANVAAVSASVLQTIATSNNEPAELRFSKLKKLIESGESGVPEKALCDCVLNILVNGQFDAEHNFVIADSTAIQQLETFLESSPTKLQCEIWGVLCAMVKRSRRNVLRCIEADLIEFLLSELQKETTTRTLADLIIELLSVLTTFSVTTKQLRLIVAALRARNSVWPRYSVQLLNVLRLMPQRSGPDEFFSFSGKRGSAICLPPLAKWPSERGWSFATWFYLDPVYGAAIERERPFLYVFKSSRGVGYSANFVGQSLVLTCMRLKGKGYQHCVKYEFATRKWYHLAVCYVYNRWSKNEVHVYVNGELVSHAELNWLVAANEPFDRCFLGTSSEQELDCMFSGCLSAVYGFTEALNIQQVAALYHLGPNYQNQFRFSNELLSTSGASRCDESERRVLFGESRLNNALLFLYNPVACDSQLCLNQAPKSATAQFFVHSPHAMMQPEVRAVSTSSICTALHSLGGIQVLYPLFSQLDAAFADDLSPRQSSASTQAEGQQSNSHETQRQVQPQPHPQIAAALMSLIVNLLEHSNVVQQQLSASRGFLVIACQLERASASHLTITLFETIVHAARYLLAPAQCSSGDLTLQRQLFDYLLFNPSLWIRAPAAVQIRLYAFLASETVVASTLYSGNAVRRTSAVLQAFHTLKYYYWIVNPRDRSGIEPKPVALANRPERKELVGIRTCVLTLVAQLISRAHGAASEELQAVLNYLSTVNEDENLPDVLQFAMRLVADYPASLVPAFDAQFGVRTVFKLLASADEHIRILALKLLGYFLLRSTFKRKTDAMNTNNLFALLGDRLLLHADRMSMSVYNTLMEILCERLTQTIHNERRVELDPNAKIENPQLLKTMATLILAARERESAAAELRKAFLLDLLLLCSNSRENRRIVLQQSVWQDWLFALAFLRPKDDFEHLVTNCVMLLFRSLLYHAIRYEYGGWRVWIDTLAVFHSRISADEFRMHIERLYRTNQLSSGPGRTQSMRVGVSSAEMQAPKEHRRSETETSASTAAAAAAAAAAAGSSARSDPEVRPLDAAGLPTSATIGEISENTQVPSQPSDAPAASLTQPPAPEAQRRLPGRVASPRSTLAPPAFRIPEYRWTPFHLRLLNDLLILIEQDVFLWKCDRTKTIVDLLNVSENQIYIQNTIHLISQLCDGLISSCGGLLPLLAAGTSHTGEIDVLEIGHGLSIEIATFYLSRLMNLADVFVFGSTANLTDLEQEKNMARGGIMRQCLRMIAMASIRGVIEGRLRQYADYRISFQPGAPNGAASEPTRPTNIVNTTTSPSNFINVARTRVAAGSAAQATQSTSAIHALLNGYYRIVAAAGSPASTDATSMTSPFSGVRHSVSVAQETIRDLQSLLQPIRDYEKLLQDVDINRLRAAIYRDLEETKQAQFLSLASLYFISVLMVSRYRDILEPPNLIASLSIPATRNGESDPVADIEAEVEAEAEAEAQAEAEAEAADGTEDTASNHDGEQRHRATISVDAQVHVDSVVESENETGPGPSPTKSKDKEKELEQEQEQDEKPDDAAAAAAQVPPEPATDLQEAATIGADQTVTEKAPEAVLAPSEYTDLETTTIMEGEAVETAASADPVAAERDAEKPEVRAEEQVASINVDQPKIATINLDETGPEPPLSASDNDSNGSPDRGRSPVPGHQQSATTASDAAHPQPQPHVTVGSELSVTVNAGAAGESVTVKMDRSMYTIVPLLKEILTDFGTFLSRTLVGSHGQELVLAGLNKLNAAATVSAAGGAGRLAPNKSLLVEMVMLLCSQEWQNSLQKNAGLAFIELVNEGRLLAHATREHVVRVANEAEFILNRMRADDVQKHAAFEALCAQSTHARLEEERLCDNLISAARARDLLLARRLKEKIVTIISITRGPWFSPRRTAREFWRLDAWEDDSRRRRRLARNPLGSSHNGAAFCRPTAVRQDSKSGDEPSVNNKSPDVVALASTGPLVNPSQPQTVTSAYVSDEELLNIGTENEKELVDESSNLLASSGPIVLALRCRLIAPGVAIVGQLSVTKSDLYFEMDDNDPENAQIDSTVLSYVEHAHGRWQFNEIRAIFSRRYLLQNVALEIFLSNRSAIMFAFVDQASVRKLVYALPRVGVGMKYGIKPSRKASLATPRQLIKLSDMTAKWQRREISNFDYLMFLNTVSGRTFNDLNQYPIFPWVLVNYDSAELDLTNPGNFRDLSKPIGALNPTRKAFFEERYQSWDDPTIPPFHFGTHYSTAAYVLNFMVRVEPFASIYLALQGGRFDHANRLFASVPQCWRNCQRDTSDVKELIPEFFYLSEMLENRNCFDLGETDEHVRVDDVELPNWARTPEDFVRINRQALESEFVSCQLHSWIDLIFGYKQRGPESVRATNVFYYLTYEGAVNLADVHDQVMRQAVENQIRNFGQTPAQLLTEPHPPRSSIMHISPLMFTRTALLDPIAFKFVSNSPLVSVAANSHPFLTQPAVVTVAANRNFTVNKWLGTPGNNQPVASPPTAAGAPQAGQPQQASQTGASPSGAAPINMSVPIQLDNLMYQTLSSGTPAGGAGAVQSRRALGDAYDQRLAPTSAHFVVTADNRAILACGFWDRSLRAFSTADARVLQVVYGHFDVVTCVVRSECNVNQDCYVVTGSRDCTLMLWLWNAKHQAIVNEAGQWDNPQPRSTYYGHQSEIVCASVSAELGLVVSGSRDGACLIHTLVGELLQWLVVESPTTGSISNGHVELQPQNSSSTTDKDSASNAGEQPVAEPSLRRSVSVVQGDLTPELVVTHREGFVVVKYGRSRLVVYTINGKLLNRVDHRDQVNAITLTRDGQYLVLGTEHGVVEVWQLHDLTFLHSFAQLDVSIRSLSMTHDQRFIVAGASSGTLIIYNVDFNRWHYEFRDRYRT